MKSKQRLTQKTPDNDSSDVNLTEVEDDEADIDVLMEIEASADDTDAMMGTTVTSYDPGDVLGEILAFVSQVWMSSEGMCEYLAHSRVLHGIKPIELRLWVCVTTSTDSGFTAMTGASQYLIMPKNMSKELAEPMNINWKTSSIHRFENG